MSDHLDQRAKDCIAACNDCATECGHCFALMAGKATFDNRPNQPRSQPRSGSTNRPTQMKKLTKFHDHWSQTR
jgi:hypothetical protein